MADNHQNEATCTACGNDIEDTDDVRYSHNNEPLHVPCYEDDRMQPTASVKYADGHIARIGHYFNETDGDFTTEWSGGQWRGSYSVTANNGWERFHYDACLMDWNDRDLKDLQDALMDYADDNGMELARILTRTSNVCSNGFSMYVRGNEEQVEELKQVAENFQKHGVATAQAVPA